MLQVGSTQVSQSSDPSLASPTTAEVEYLLTSASMLFPGARLTADSIAFSYAGVYPIPSHQGKGLTPARFDSLSCRFFMHNHADEGALGLLSIFGGTLATASSLAEKTARAMGLHLGRMPTAPLGFDASGDVESTLQQWASAVHMSTGLPCQSTDAIARWHGRHAMCVVHAASRDPVLRLPIVDGLPQIVAQATEAVAYEHAFSLADILLRRVPIALDQNWDENRTVQAAARIAPALQWSERRMKEEVEEFEEERSRFLHKPKNLKSTGIAAA
jgi:glycerol-3-phosphate dehydrogenase